MSTTNNLLEKFKNSHVKKNEMNNVCVFFEINVTSIFVYVLINVARYFCLLSRNNKIKTQIKLFSNLFNVEIAKADFNFAG